MDNFLLEWVAAVVEDGDLTDCYLLQTAVVEETTKWLDSTEKGTGRKSKEKKREAKKKAWIQKNDIKETKKRGKRKASYDKNEKLLFEEEKVIKSRLKEREKACRSEKGFVESVKGLLRATRWKEGKKGGGGERRQCGECVQKVV